MTTPVGTGGAGDASASTDGHAPPPGLRQLQVAAEEAATAARNAERKVEKQRQQLAAADAVLVDALTAETQAIAAVEAEHRRWMAENGAGDR
jgi:hypothetical protein